MTLRQSIKYFLGLLALELFLAFFTPGHYFDISCHKTWTDTAIRYGFHNIYTYPYKTAINGELSCNYTPVSPTVWYFTGLFYYGLHLDQRLSMRTFDYYNYLLDSGERRYYWPDNPRTRAVYQRYVARGDIKNGYRHQPNPLRHNQYISVGDQLYSFLLRLWPIAGNILLLFLFFIYFPKPLQKNYWLSLLMIFNPLFIVNSAIWGQTDVVSAAFLLWAFLSLIYSRKPGWSLVIMIIALNVKFMNFLFLPFYLAAFIYFNRAKILYWPAVFSWLSATLVTWIVIYLPFLANGAYVYIFKDIIWAQMTGGGAGVAYLSTDTWNFWWLFMRRPGQNSLLDASSNTYLGFIKPAVVAPLFVELAMAVIIIFFCYWLWKNKNHKQAPVFIFYSMAVFQLLITMFMIGMFSRYIYPVVILMIAVYLADKRYRPLGVPLLIFNLLLFMSIYHGVEQPLNPLFHLLRTLHIYPAYTYPAALVNLAITVYFLRVYYREFIRR